MRITPTVSVINHTGNPQGRRGVSWGFFWVFVGLVWIFVVFVVLLFGWLVGCFFLHFRNFKPIRKLMRKTVVAVHSELRLYKSWGFKCVAIEEIAFAF